MSPSDLDLVTRVLAQDDRHAYGELVRRHQSAVRALLRRLTSGEHALADDLAQETFLAAHRSLPRFRGDAAFSTWLLGIACQLWRNHRRRTRPTVEWDETTALHASASSTSATETPDPTPELDLRHDLSAALARLPEEERAALHLCYAEGLTHAEAAEALGTPLGTVKTHVNRAKEKLRHWLRAWAPA